MNSTDAPVKPAPPANPPDPARARRKGGELMLTGRGGYLDDVVMPGMLHAAILRSPHARADILGTDLDAARAMPGVRLALDGAQLAEHLPRIAHLFDPAAFGAHTASFRALAVDRVIHEGEPVAVVVADTLAAAEAARDAIQVRYASSQPVTDMRAALKPASPLVFEDWGTNALGDFPFQEGDPDAAFAGAPHVVEGEIRIQRYNTAPLETRGYVASWGDDGRLTFYASTQNPHPLRTLLATMLGISESDIRVIATRVGGGFGHKFPGFPEEGLLAVVSRIVDAPVKWLETREDCMLVGGREYHHTFAAAYDDTGRILALRDRVLGDVGALGAGGGWGMVYVAGMTLPGPYKILDYDIRAVPVVTNKPPWNGAIGYGKESATLLLERIVELIAADLGIDSVNVRMVNFIPKDEFPYWVGAKRLDSGDYAGALRQLVELGDLEQRRRTRAERRARNELPGLGLAFELCPEGGDFPGSLLRGYDTATIRVDPAGAVTVLSGVTNPGTGNDTGIAQVVAGELGVELGQVTVRQGDTDVSPYGFGNFSSRGMNVGGGSALLAARVIRERLARAAAVLLEIDAADLEFVAGRIRPRGAGEGIAFGEVANKVYGMSIAIPGIDEPQLEATRTWGPENMLHVPDERGRTSGYPTFPYSAHLAEVELDRATGVVTIHDYTCVHDCGVVINPTFVEGQLQGSIAMGIGGALWEELPYDRDGRLGARTFKQYLTARAPDLPRVRLGHQVTPSPYTLLGTKGAGESGVSGAVAAIANAVNDALSPLGAVVHEMPLTPPRLLAAINEASR